MVPALQGSTASYRYTALLFVCLTILALPKTAAAQSGSDKETPAERRQSCASLREERRRQIDRCKTQEERDADAQEKRRKEEAERERPSRTSFLRRLHLDGLWIPTSTGAGQYGVIGTHLDVGSIGRLHFFGPPGLMLVTEQTEDGWRLRPAFTWGISVFIGGVQLPGAKDKAQLYFNFAKTWTAGNMQTGRDLAGLSLSWKKR